MGLAVAIRVSGKHEAERIARAQFVKQPDAGAVAFRQFKIFRDIHQHLVADFELAAVFLSNVGVKNCAVIPIRRCHGRGAEEHFVSLVMNVGCFPRPAAAERGFSNESDIVFVPP